MAQLVAPGQKAALQGGGGSRRACQVAISAEYEKCCKDQLARRLELNKFSSIWRNLFTTETHRRDLENRMLSFKCAYTEELLCEKCDFIPQFARVYPDVLMTRVKSSKLTFGSASAAVARSGPAQTRAPASRPVA